MRMAKKTATNVPMTRRFFLHGMGCTAIGLSPAFALTPDHEAMPLSAREWADGFDTATVGPGDVLTSTPTMSVEVLGASEQAMQRYSDILARGGWPPVPAQGTLRLGLHDPIVMSLRQRLMASGDLSEIVGSPGTFDTYVEAAVKRFQARHGIVADGVVGDATLTALNIPAA
jgi:murein L,D-transpeptidase YcbB/YkuD